ncbi:hypothetical protein BKA62DRAFT_700554 [Auriculariales sp. MPI-PUGE-AT-0066]|nr:hypothetical protein BKA62DRAFT_700554 [Auriculariales sp. MPI-PUGE-AT-0066]
MPPARKPPVAMSSIVHRGIVLTLFGITTWGMAHLFYFQPMDRIKRGKELYENQIEYAKKKEENEQAAKDKVEKREVLLARAAQAAVPSHRLRVADGDS